jgi:hypothetical protein
MSNQDEEFAALMKRSTSSARRINPEETADRLGVSGRTLEDWRRAWRKADKDRNPALRKGPPFIKLSRKRVLYTVSDVDAFDSTYQRRQARKENTAEK